VPPLPRLRRHFENIQDVNADRGFTRGCMLGNFTAEVADHSPAIRDAIARHFGGWSAAIADVLREAAERGDLRRELEPETTARFILNAWEGALIDSRVAKSTEAFNGFFTNVFDLLLSA